MFMENLLTACGPGTHLLIKKAFGYKKQRQNAVGGQ